MNALAAQVERKTGHPTPRADPDSGGRGARVLLLLETPSVAAAHGSGIVSIDNDDATAANLWRAFAETGLDRDVSLLWNVVPWFVGTAEVGATPTAAELLLGRAWLASFLALLPRLRVLVALGGSAQAAVAPLDLRVRNVAVLLSPHPSHRVDNRPGFAARERVHAALAQAADLTREPQAS